jgi:hypothetical protein
MDTSAALAPNFGLAFRNFAPQKRLLWLGQNLQMTDSALRISSRESPAATPKSGLPADQCASF